MKTFIIDRFEGSFAVCETENGDFINIPAVVLPDNSKEGDVITVAKDIKQTESRKDRIGGLMNSLFND